MQSQLVLWKPRPPNRPKAEARAKYELSLLRRGHALMVRQRRLSSRPAFPEIQVHNARVGFFEPAEFDAVVREPGLDLSGPRGEHGEVEISLDHEGKAPGEHRRCARVREATKSRSVSAQRTKSTLMISLVTQGNGVAVPVDRNGHKGGLPNGPHP